MFWSPVLETIQPFALFVQVVLDRRKIIFAYLKGWFIVDLVSSFPFDLIYLAVQTGNDDEKVDAEVNTEIMNSTARLTLRVLK